MAAANSVGGDGCARHERERETEEGESSGESEGRSGRRVASSGASLGRPRRKQEVARGGSRRWPRQRRRAPRLASARPPGRGGRGQRRRRWAGPAGGAGPVVAPGKVSLLSLAFSNYFSFSILQVCFEFGFETNSIYFASDNIFRS